MVGRWVWCSVGLGLLQSRPCAWLRRGEFYHLGVEIVGLYQEIKVFL